LRRAASQRPHWLQWGAPNSPQNCPFPFDDHHPYLIRPSLNRSHSLPQTAPGSNQPFCHSTLSGQTDRPTDKWARRQARNMSRLRSLVRSDATKNTRVKYKIYALRWQRNSISRWLRPGRHSRTLSTRNSAQKACLERDIGKVAYWVSGVQNYDVANSTVNVSNDE